MGDDLAASFIFLPDLFFLAKQIIGFFFFFFGPFTGGILVFTPISSHELLSTDFFYFFLFTCSADVGRHIL